MVQYKRVRDPGLQSERTVLSWLRTAAVVFLNGLLLIKIGTYSDYYFLFILGFLTIFLALIIYIHGINRDSFVHNNKEVLTRKTVILHGMISLILIFVSLSLAAYFLLPLSIYKLNT